MMVLTIYGIITLQHMKIHTRWQNVILSSFSVNMLCGILGNYITEPHSIETHLRAACYRDFLKNDLPLYLHNMLPATQGRMWIQHVKAHTHFSR
jgi:hypothetical protein